MVGVSGWGGWLSCLWGRRCIERCGGEGFVGHLGDAFGVGDAQAIGLDGGDGGAPIAGAIGKREGGVVCGLGKCRCREGQGGKQDE